MRLVSLCSRLSPSKFDAFLSVDGYIPGRSAHDKRLSLADWLKGYKGAIQHGFVALQGVSSEAGAKEVFQKIDTSRAEVVLVDEWCSFLKNCEIAAGTALGKLWLGNMEDASGLSSASFALTLPRDGAAKAPPLLSSGRKVVAAPTPPAASPNAFEVVTKLRPDLLSAAANMTAEERAQLAAALSSSAPAASIPVSQPSTGRGFVSSLFARNKKPEAEAEELVRKTALENRLKREKEVRMSFVCLEPGLGCGAFIFGLSYTKSYIVLSLSLSLTLSVFFVFWHNFGMVRKRRQPPAKRASMS